MRQSRFPPNLYGFRSLILGLSPDRIIILAVFAFIAFLVYRILPIVAIALLAVGLLVTIYKRGQKHVLFRLVGWISWKLSRKSFDIQMNFTSNTKDFTFVKENNKAGIVFRLLSSDIYDVSEGLSASIYDSVRRALNSVNGEMKIFLVPLNQKNEAKPNENESEGAASYNNMVSGLISRSVYHSVYIAVFGDIVNQNSQLAGLEKSALNIIALLEGSGFSTRKTVTEEELESIYLHSI
jgi:hypothetical protein